MAAITGFHLPEDVMIEILVRLPVKSLVRFKRVCKSWYALIKNPSFISRHLNSSTHFNDEENDRVVLKHWNEVTRKTSVSFLANETAAAELSGNLPVPFFDDDNVDLHAVTLYGPCNGIFCVYGDHKPTKSFRNRRYRRGDLVSLWNPATGEIKRLSDSSFPRADDGDEQVVWVEVGFGFDHKSNDYKVVRIIDLGMWVGRRCLIEVYDLSTDCWRKIDAVVPTRFLGLEAHSTYLDGFYYWWSGLRECVISFDFSDEVFEMILPPERSRLAVHLRNYNGCVTLVADDTSDQGIVNCHAVWVLNREGDKKTWTRLYNIMFECARFHEFSRIGVIFMVNGDDHEKFELALFEPSSGQVTNLGVYDPVNFILQAVHYVESLVSFRGANRFGSVRFGEKLKLNLSNSV